MISALVISLKHAEERRNFQRQQLQSLNIPFEIMDATVFDKSAAADYSRGLRPWQRPLLHTEVATLESHKRAWQHVIETNQPLLILEDDVVLHESLRSVLANIERILAQDSIDCLNFETRIRKKHLGCFFTKLPSCHVEIVHLIQDRAGAAAYLLTPAAAKKLMKANEGKLGLADALLWSTRTLKFAQSDPALAVQADMADRYKFESPFDATSYINRVGDRPKSSVSYKLRRLWAQLALAWRFATIFHKTTARHVRLADLSTKSE